jgi:hypothetical protein
MASAGLEGVEKVSRRPQPDRPGGNRIVRLRLGGWPEVWTVPLDGDGGTGEPAAVLAGSYGRLRHAAVAADGPL